MIFGEKVGELMTLQKQVIQKVNTLLEDILQFLLDMMNHEIPAIFGGVKCYSRYRI